MADDVVWATLALAMVSVSLPFYLYGAWIVLDAEFVSWSILVRHLRYIGVGLALTTGPVLGWMLPRLLDQLGGYAALHAIVGIQAYALLAFALTGIVRIFLAKHRHDLYHNPDPEIDLDDLDENMGAWRFRLRVGVFGFLICWAIAYVIGVLRFVVRYSVF